MAASSAPGPSTTTSLPPWRYDCSEEDLSRIDSSLQALTGRALIGRMVSHSPARTSIRDWCQSALGTSQGRVVELSFLGRGIFIVRLSDAATAQTLLSRSPIVSGSRLIYLTPWYPDFTVEEFEHRQVLPRFPLTISFPNLPLHFRDLVPSIVSSWGLVIPGSFSMTSGSPRIQVYVLGGTEIPASIQIGVRASTFLQSVLVTGRPGQCLRCHEMGHLARHCPSQPFSRQQQQRPQQPVPPQRQHHPQPASEPSRPPPPPPTAGEGGWQSVSRRHTFRATSEAPLPPLVQPAPPSSSQLLHRPVQQHLLQEVPSSSPPRQACSPSVQQVQFQASSPSPSLVSETQLAASPSRPAAISQEQVTPSSPLLVLQATSSPLRPTSPPLCLPPPPPLPRPLPPLPPLSLPSQSDMVIDQPVSPPPPRQLCLPRPPSSRAFLDFCPPQWGADRAACSGDDLGPFQIRLYLLQRSSGSTPSLVGSRSTPFLSFYLPFQGSEEWDEDRVLHFVHHHTLSRLQVWLQHAVPDFLSPSFPGCVGAMEWLDGEGSFCLPLVIFVPHASVLPSPMHIWSKRDASKMLACSLTYMKTWCSDIQSFATGKRVKHLPRDQFALTRQVRSAQPSGKRPRH